ncbi:MAG: hypothetical protein [Bacteriophage sp.]|nr:MAG: hypothetical protein [Bacteriophage sp.]
MTEPVAYLYTTDKNKKEIYLEFGISDNKNFNSIPLYTKEQLHPRVKMTQAEFNELETSLINAQFDYSELKKTIEIIPDMKWFVRSKEQYQPDMDQGISESGYLYLTQGDIYSIEYYETTPFKDDSQQFDTKEEAEKWTNPLTEAVQLAVEDE